MHGFVCSFLLYALFYLLQDAIRAFVMASKNTATGIRHVTVGMIVVVVVVTHHNLTQIPRTSEKNVGACSML